jgi:hypothetical protein
MTIRMFFTILAVLSFLFGVGFVLAPDHVLADYGIEHSPALALLGRLFGGAAAGSRASATSPARFFARFRV